MAEARAEWASIGTVVAAASAPDIWIDGQVHSVSGTTSIAGFATASAGLLRVLYFETATPLVNSTALGLPGAASITTRTGDVAVVRSLGNANAKVESYTRADGTPLAPSSNGKHKLWIPAAAMRPQATSGPASADVLLTAAQYYFLDFDQSSDEATHFSISLPSSWNEGTVTFVPVWTAASGSGDVVWRLGGTAISNDDTLSVSLPSTVSSTDTLITANDNHRGPESSALTIAGTPAANDLVQFVFFRDADAGGDTLNADARLLGIELYFTTDAAVDVAT